MEGQVDFDESILFVDSDEKYRDMFQKMCLEHSISGVFVENAYDALSSLGSTPIFCVISDADIHDMGGLRLCEKIRDMGIQTSFLLMSQLDLSDLDKDKALQSGVSNILKKSTDLQSVFDLIIRAKNERIAEISDELIENMEIKEIFLEEANDLLLDLETLIMKLDKLPLDTEIIDIIYRRIHTVKGHASSTEGTKDFHDLAQALESVLGEMKASRIQPGTHLIDVFLACSDTLKAHLLTLKDMDVDMERPPVDHLIKSLAAIAKNDVPPDLTGTDHQQKVAPIPMSTSNPSKKSAKTSDDDGVMVSNEKLDNFMGLAGQLVAFRNIFQGYTKNICATDIGNKTESDMLEKMLTKISDQIQDQIMDIRRVSMGRTFGKYPRVVRQIAAATNKEIDLEIIGQDITVDKTIAKSLTSSLIHAIRNACDHGIETKDARISKGKPSTGRVVLKAEERNAVTHITLTDDGAGVDREQVRKQAVKKGLIDNEKSQKLSDSEIFGMIFLPGFSTSQKVTDISGHGVGMDVIHSTISQVGGKVSIKSQPDLGSTLSIEIPVPKSVVMEQSVIAKSGPIHLAIPLTTIAEVRQAEDDRLTLVRNQWTTQFNNTTVPVGTFGEFLNLSDETEVINESNLILIIKHKKSCIGLKIESISEQVQAVVRPFDGITRKIRGFSGVTILSDNVVAYVVSAEEMIDAALESVNLMEK